MGLLVLYMMFCGSTSVAILLLCIYTVYIYTYILYIYIFVVVWTFGLVPFITILLYSEMYMFVAKCKFSAPLTNGRHFCVICLTNYWTVSLLLLQFNPWSKGKNHLLKRALKTIITPCSWKESTLFCISHVLLSETYLCVIHWGLVERKQIIAEI